MVADVFRFYWRGGFNRATVL